MAAAAAASVGAGAIRARPATSGLSISRKLGSARRSANRGPYCYAINGIAARKGNAEAADDRPS